MRRSVAVWAALIAALTTGTGCASDTGQAAPPRYISPAVEVTEGVDLDQDEVTAEISRMVDDPRGWRTDLGQYTVRIVPAGTHGTERMPGLIGRAYIADGYVVVSDQAWTELGPKFAAVGGTLADQRTWIVLHEIGHLLHGEDHEECPGSGPAPAMRSYNFDLRGCGYNIWPNPDGV